MGSRVRTFAGVFAASLVPVLGALAACRAPTEVTLNITTDVNCADFRGASIVVGHADEVETKPSATSTTTCDANGNVGSLVLVPSGGEDDEVVVRIAAGVDRDSDSCDQAGIAASGATGCIVARRDVRYIAHTPLILDVPLRSSCNGIICSNDQTCVAGVCRSDVVPSSCESGGTCGESALGAADAGAPADASTADATILDATVVDSGPRAATSCSDPGLQDNAPWPAFGRCGDHRASSPYPGVGADGGAFLYYGEPESSVTIVPLAIAASGRVYGGGSDGALRAVDRSTLAWKTQIGTSAITAVTIAADGTLYVSDANTLHHLSSDGSMMQNRSATIPPAILPDGRVVVGAGTVVETLSADLSTVSWSSDATPLVATGVAVGGDGLVRATWAGKFASFDANGVATRTSTDNDFTGLAVVDDLSTLAEDPEGTETFFANDPAASLAAGKTIAGIALLDNTMYMAQTGSLTAAYKWTLVTPAPVPDGGSDRGYTMVWVTTLQPNGVSIIGPPAVDVNGSMYLSCSDDTVRQYSDSGVLLQTFSLQPLPLASASPIIGNGVVYVGTTGGTIFELE